MASRPVRALEQEQLSPALVECALDGSDGHRGGDQPAEPTPLGLITELAPAWAIQVLSTLVETGCFSFGLDVPREGGEPGAQVLNGHGVPAAGRPARHARQS